MRSEFINEKVKQLNKEWVEHTRNVENDIKMELINEWTKKHGINPGDDILVKDFRSYRKINKNVCYYRKAKLMGLNVNVYLNSYSENSNGMYITPIIQVYDANNKTLQKKTLRYLEFFKMDLNLLGKEVKEVNKTN
jgi:hypothetical protein